VEQWPAHSGRRHFGFEPKKFSTPVHWADVVQSGKLGADDVDGLFEGFMDGGDEGSAVGAGDADGVDEGFAKGADDVDGSAVGRNVGMNEGSNDMDGFDDGVDDHDDEVNGSQIGLFPSRLDPNSCVLNQT